MRARARRAGSVSGTAGPGSIRPLPSPQLRTSARDRSTRTSISCPWRTEDEDARIKLLEREMAMATLFAAEAFALANRPETRVRIHSWVKTAPLFGDEAS